MDSTISHFVCEILQVGVESMGRILCPYPVWLFGVGEREETLLFAKAKSSKSFYALCAKFWEFVESRADSAS